MQESRSIIIGGGEVGTALLDVLDQYDPDMVDLTKASFSNHNEAYEYMHICIPYSDKFIEYVKAYQEEYKPKYTIIHSTVPVGTSRACGALHSPIRGIHPKLSDGIRVFAKFIGGDDASSVADYFRKADVRVVLFDKQETTEALKLFDTEYFRECIEFAQRVARYCKKEGLNFHEVYTLPNQTYNEGYTKLDHPEYVRPVLQPIMGPIGGHCVLPNKELIAKSE